jgi:hypothetical protein
VTKLQKKSTMSSFASAFMDPTGRETEITLLKEHFQEAEKSILVRLYAYSTVICLISAVFQLAVGLDTSILVNQVKDTVVAQQHIELDTNNRINEIAPLVRETYSLARQFVGRSPPQPTDEDGVRLYPNLFVYCLNCHLFSSIYTLERTSSSSPKYANPNLN